MAITSIKTGSSFTNLQKFDTAVASNPPLMAAPTATDGGTGSTASVAFTTVTGATSYGVLSSPGSFTATGTSSPLTVSGLTSGTAYTFQVRGINSTSTGPYSAASNSVTPVTPTAFESIASVTGDGSTGTYTFSSIPSTYKSLQIRMSALKSGGSGEMRLRINGDTGGNYVWHNLWGYNSSVGSRAGTGQSYIQISSNVNNDADMSTTAPSVAIIDIHNYASTTQNKTVRSWGGVNQNNAANSDINLNSGLWLNTAAVTSLTVYYSAANTLASGTTIALYGIRG